MVYLWNYNTLLEFTNNHDSAIAVKLTWNFPNKFRLGIEYLFTKLPNSICIQSVLPTKSLIPFLVLNIDCYRPLAVQLPLTPNNSTCEVGKSITLGGLYFESTKSAWCHFYCDRGHRRLSLWQTIIQSMMTKLVSGQHLNVCELCAFCPQWMIGQRCLRLILFFRNISIRVQQNLM